MNKPTVEDILAPKPTARPRIYAYSITDEAHAGLLKVGQTTRDVALRVAEQLKTAAIKNYTIVLDEAAEAVGPAAGNPVDHVAAVAGAQRDGATGVEKIVLRECRGIAFLQVFEWPVAPVAADPPIRDLPEIEGDSWVGILAPAGTPAEIVNALHGESANILAQPAMKESGRLLLPGASRAAGIPFCCPVGSDRA